MHGSHYSITFCLSYFIQFATYVAILETLSKIIKYSVFAYFKLAHLPIP